MELTVGRAALTAACISKAPFAALTCMVNIPVCESLSPLLKESVKKAKGMSSLNLMQEVVEKTSVVRRLVHELQPEDPLRAWFSLELDSLAIDSENEAQLSLDETHARLRALDQLQYLVFRHKVYLGNPEIEKDETDGKASLLTVEAAIPANVFESAEHLKFTIEPQLLHDPTQENNQFDPVSPTAKIVGYLRGQDQTLRLSDETKFEEEGQRLLAEADIGDGLTQASMAVLFQSRYHAMNAAIASHQPRQIVEFAAGISPRGLQWSSTCPGTIYIESDLPQLMIRKSKLIRNSLVAKENELKGVLHCCAVDVLDEASVMQCLRSLDSSQPLVMVTEGLLLYFSDEEMSKFLRIMSSALERFKEAVWVSDIVTKENLMELFGSDPQVAQSVKHVFSLTGREVAQANPFEHYVDAKKKFAEYDLAVDREISLASTTARLQFDVNLPQDQRDRIVGSRSIWQISRRANESQTIQ